MKRILLLSVLVASAVLAHAQAMIAAPNALYLVYNNVGNYYYLKIDGKEKSTTAIDNMFIMDGKTVQLLNVKTATFLPDSLATLTPRQVLESYFLFEKDYLDTLFQGEITYNTEYGKFRNGREYIFWSFKSPLLENPPVSDSDSTRTTLIDSQLYAATDVGNQIVAVSCPYFKDEIPFEQLKRYMLDIIESVTISPTRIDIFELDRRVNGE